jgi:hypothetical protein
LIDHIDSYVGLSTAQRLKLKLAGKIELKRLAEQLPTRRQVAQAAEAAGGDEPEMVRALAAALTEESSSFSKLLKQMLSAEQVDKLEARGQYIRQAVRLGAVAALAESVPLTDRQWEELATLLEKEIQPAMSDLVLDYWAIVLAIPRAGLRKILGEAQWKLLDSILDDQQTKRSDANDRIRRVQGFFFDAPAPRRNRR